MEHVLIHCRAPPASTIWSLAHQLWPHAPQLWPTLSLGIVLGCGAIHLPNQDPQPGATPHPQANPLSNRGTKRLLQILISESAHLIWVLRCERAIRDKHHSTREIQSRWLQAINTRLTEDKITATRIKRDKSYTTLVSTTWAPVLSRDSDPPNLHNWIYNREVLVGRRHLRPPP